MRAYAHLEGPGWGHLLGHYGSNDARDWFTAPTVRARDKRYGHHLKLDLSDFFHRLAYFVGGYHELEAVAAFQGGLLPGDHVLDGGANIGLLAMLAAELVGPGGRVDAFEPMPTVFERLTWHITTNRLRQVHLHNLGLDDAPAQFEMRLPGVDNQAAGTFAPVPERFGGQFKSVGWGKVVRGDDVLDAAATAPLFIKLDIEGFEARALIGLRRTIARRRPAIFTEVNAEMLHLAGSSAEGIYDSLTGAGYSAWAVDRGGFRARFRLWLHPVGRHQIHMERDLLFLTPDGPHWARYAPCMRPPGHYWKHLGVKPGTGTKF